MKVGPSFHFGTFLDDLLKPVVADYCKGDIIKDSAEFLMGLNEMEKEGQTTN